MKKLLNRQNVIWRLLAAAALLWAASFSGIFSLTTLGFIGGFDFAYDALPIYGVMITAVLISAAIWQVIKPKFRLVLIAVLMLVIFYIWVISLSGVTLQGSPEFSEYIKADPLMTPDKITTSLFEVITIFTTVILPSFLTIWVNWPVKQPPIENEFS